MSASNADDVSLDIIAEGSGGARARAKRIARTGLGKIAANQEMNTKRKAAVRFRMARALMWDRERILIETGWSLQWFMSVEKYVNDEDRRVWSETDSRTLFATYREQQLQIVRELEDLSAIFRKSKQFNALVTASRTRADVLDRIIKTGQELGVIHKTAKQVEINAAVDVTTLSVAELRIHVQEQIGKITDMIEVKSAPAGAAGVVYERMQRQLDVAQGEDLEPEPKVTARVTRRAPRVKRVA